MEGWMLGWMALWIPNCRAWSGMEPNGMGRHGKAWGTLTSIYVRSLHITADTGLAMSLNYSLKQALAKLAPGG